MDYEEIWSFCTARFAVRLDWTPEVDSDVSWADAETLDKLADGTYVEATFRVRVLFDDVEIACDYLGNSVYEDVRQFRREHLNVHGGGYFPDMVREAIRAARARLCNVPRLRCA